MKKKIMAGILALTMILTMMPVNGSTVKAASDVTLLNDGYPYGKDMSEKSVTLVMDAQGEGLTYQWQKADAKDGNYSDIDGATGSTYTISTPTKTITIRGNDGNDIEEEVPDYSQLTWYRCVVGGNTYSKAVETVYPNVDVDDDDYYVDSNGRRWTNPMSSWYISNGTMAYMVGQIEYDNKEITVFDATGLYTKDGKDYMLCTSYGECWEMYDPSGSYNVSLDALRVSFNESNAYDLIFEADLPDGVQAFSFGADTQLGSSATSGNYYDAAALQAMTSRGKLKQIAMIGAASVADADDADPAFVISPIDECSQFWIGNFYSREPYSFNTSVDDGVKEKKTISEVSGVATLLEDEDSGMTMSWTNVESGGSVRFKFGVGSVRDTGAVRTKVNYRDEVLYGLDANKNYVISYTEEGTDYSYIITTDKDGQLPLTGKDINSREYDFMGKSINVAKQGSEDLSADMTIAARPTTPNNPSELGGNGSDTSSGSTPQLVEKIEITELGTTSFTVNPISGQEYSYSTDGENWTTLTDANKDASGHYVATGLSEGSPVYIRTRVSATDKTFASAWSETTTLKLMNTIKATVTAYSGTYDGQSHNITVASETEGATVKYSLNKNSNYSTEDPELKNAGKYTVYYRVEKEGCYPSCGSSTVTIGKKEVELTWPNTSLTYNGTTNLPTATVSGVVEGDECVANVSLNGSGSPVNVGSYTAKATLSNNNYVIKSGQGQQSFSIVRANKVETPTITAVDETVAGKKDGKVSGLTTEMEYRLSGQTDYVSVTDPDMTFDCGTYEIRYKETDNYNASEPVSVTIAAGEKLRISLSNSTQEDPGYTIDYDKTEVEWDGSISFTIATKEGYTKLPTFAVTVNDETITPDSTGKYTINNVQSDQVVTVTGIEDITNPTGQITLGTNVWKTFLNEITFNLFFKETQHVTIAPDDKGSGLESTEYYLYTPTADKSSLDLDALARITTWTEGTELYINPDATCIIYVKITDKAGNVTYISSDGIIVDNTSPVVEGISDGYTYSQDQILNITDASLKSVTYKVGTGDSVTLTPQENGTYILPIASIAKEQGTEDIIVTVEDNTGHKTVRSIKAGHVYDKGSVVEPTALEKGYTLYTCTHSTDGTPCGMTHKDSYVIPYGLDRTAANDKAGITTIKTGAENKLTDTTLSAEDKTFYQDVVTKANQMLADIAKAEALKQEIDEMNIPGITNPTADDATTLNNALIKINALLNVDDTSTPTQSLTETQVEELEALKAVVEGKLGLIDEVSEGIKSIKNGTADILGVDAINNMETVTADDQEQLEKVLLRIETFQEKYNSNLTESQRNTLETYYADVFAKLKKAAKLEIDEKLEDVIGRLKAAVSDEDKLQTLIETAREVASNGKTAVDDTTSRAALVEARDTAKADLDNIAKAEEAVNIVPEIIPEIQVSETSKKGIAQEVKNGLASAGIDNAEVKVTDYSKNAATLNKTGKVTATVEINVGDNIETVEIEKELPKLSSSVDYKSTVTKDTPKTSVSVDTKSLMENVLGEEELDALAEGGSADITLSVSNKDAKVTKAEEKAVAAKLDKDMKIGKYLDISLYLSVVDANGQLVVENENIHEPGTTFTITVNIPDELKTSADKTRTYQIIRVHDGVAEVLDSVYDESKSTLTFKTDKFSTYAIAYSEAGGTEAVTSPKTGDNAADMLYLLVLFAGIAVCTIGKEKTYNRKK